MPNLDIPPSRTPITKDLITRDWAIFMQQIYNNITKPQVAGDIEVTAIGSGIIVRSPDGTRWRLTPSNAGTSVWTAI